MTKFKNLTEQAAKYQEIMQQIKSLEEQVAPLKKQLLTYAKELNQAILSVGDLTIERRTTEKIVFDEEKLTPDWLYRLGENSGRCFLKIGIDRKIFGNIACGELVEELGGSVAKSNTFAIRV